MNTSYFSRTVAVALLIASSASAHASPLSSEESSSMNCSSLLRECVALSSERRTNCFQSASKDIRCKHTELSKVSFLRGTLGPQQNDEEFALLGPQIVEPQCVERFDNQLSAELIRGAISDDVARSLFQRLQSCRATNVDDVFRP